jgi:hypothetical protein
MNSRTLTSLSCKVLGAIKQTTALLRCLSLLPPALPYGRPRSLWHSAPCALPRLGSHASCRYLLPAQSLQYVVQLARAANSTTPRWHAVESGARCHEPARHRGAGAAMLQCGAACFDCRAQPPAAARVAAPATGRRQCSAHLLMMMKGGGDLNCTLRSLFASCVGVVFSQRGCSSAFNPDIEYFLFRFEIAWPWIADVV